MPRTLRRWSFLKKSPRHLGDDPGGPPEGHSSRTVVAGRGPCRPEEQDRPALGPTGHPAPGPARSADELGLHLRGDLPATGQGRGLGAAAMRYAGHEPAPGGSLAGCGSRSPWGHADGPGRMAPHQGPRRAGQPHAGAAASPSARIEPGREHLAFSARELVVEPRVRLLPRHRRSRLRRVEPPHRPALDHHVHRPPGLGQCIQCMMISAGWYNLSLRRHRRGQAAFGLILLSAMAVSGGVDFGAQPSARASDGLILTPFLRAPALCWWARTMVESIIAYSLSASSDRWLKTLSQTPLFAHRLKRVWIVSGSPNRSGKSRHGMPAR